MPLLRQYTLVFLFLAICIATPVRASESEERLTDAFDLRSVEEGQNPKTRGAWSQEERPQEEWQGPPPGVRIGQAGPPNGAPSRPVFDDTWATIGIGAGLVPSYSGSDDYRAFPLPLIVGRVGGVGISPNGPGFNLNLLSKPPIRGPAKTSVAFGPSFRFRNDRVNQIEDEVVELAGELDTAIEVGVNGGVSFPDVFAPRDRLSVSTQVRWDILDAHDGMLIEPGVSYFRPIGSGASVQVSASASFVDDSFADYYYSVSPDQSAASGLPQFTADGGLNSLGLTSIFTLDLDNDALNGGFSVYGIAGYSRLIGDAADTPYTSIRGNADQFIGGVGIGYTF